MPTTEDPARPTVSVVMPAYNAEAYIGEAIASILGQTYRDFELIVVDDGSTDRTGDLAERAARDDPRVKAAHNPENLGIEGTLNRGLGLARGRFIARMDADDVALPERLERQVAFLETHPDIAICGTGILEIDASGEPFRQRPIVSGPDTLFKLLRWCSPLAHPTIMFRREILDVVHGYRQLAPAEDYDFFLRGAESGFRMDNIPYYGLKLRLSPSNTASRRGLIQRKAFNYVKHLRRLRRRKGRDDYSPEAFHRAIECSAFYVSCHAMSQRMFDRAVADKERKGLLFAAWFAVAMLLSPHQAQFIMRNLLIKFSLRMSGLPDKQYSFGEGNS